MPTNAAAVSRKLRELGYCKDHWSKLPFRVRNCTSPAAEAGEVYLWLSGRDLRGLPRGIDGLVTDLDSAGLTVVKVQWPPNDPECETYGPWVFVAKKTEN